MKSISELKKQWEHTLFDITKHFLKDSNIDTRGAAAETLPPLLELATFGKKETGHAVQFIVMTAPSGVGKGTIGKILEQKGIKKLVRINTRRIRHAESQDEYHFINEQAYDQLLKRNGILCPTSSESHRAGIEKKLFFQMLHEKTPFYIDTGAGTARQIRHELLSSGINFLIIFILPPTFDEMVRRIHKRGDMKEKIILQRLETALKHLQETPKTTDLFVVNDIALRAAEKMAKLFIS